MRSPKEVAEEFITWTGQYQQVYPKVKQSKAPSPLKVKDVLHHGRRYMVCLNKDQAQQDAAVTEMPSLLH